MGVGKQIRLNRLFAHPSGRMCSLAVDHYCAYQRGLPHGLRNIPAVLAQLVDVGPDAITMHKGMAKNAWKPGVSERVSSPSTYRRPTWPSGTTRA